MTVYYYIIILKWKVALITNLLTNNDIKYTVNIQSDSNSLSIMLTLIPTK